MFDFHENWMLCLKDKNGQVLAHVEITKNRAFKLNLKIKALSLMREGKVEAAEKVLETSKTFETHII